LVHVLLHSKCKRGRKGRSCRKKKAKAVLKTHIAHCKGNKKCITKRKHQIKKLKRRLKKVDHKCTKKCGKNSKCFKKCMKKSKGRSKAHQVAHKAIKTCGQVKCAGLRGAKKRRCLKAKCLKKLTGISPVVVALYKRKLGKCGHLRGAAKHACNKKAEHQYHRLKKLPKAAQGKCRSACGKNLKCLYKCAKKRGARSTGSGNHLGATAGTTSSGAGGHTGNLHVLNNINVKAPVIRHRARKA